MRPSRSRRTRRTHRNRRTQHRGAGDNPSLLKFVPAPTYHPNLPVQPLNPPPYVYVNPPVNPAPVNLKPPFTPQLQKTKPGGKRRTRRSRR